MQSASGLPPSFHPLVREWFLARYGAPTAVQAETWERSSRGEHVLALAPTGSGKTLAAFLDALSALIAGDLPADSLSVLYVSPLKALNEDIRRNLEAPLAELAALAAQSGQAFPPIRVETRSGDTPEAERRRFLTRPPSILCTTPESLAILLDSPRARPILATVKCLVLDEVHAVAGNKRGALLACSVGRLTLLAGEIRRIALSATVNPPERAAAFVGGLRLLGEPGRGARLLPRPVALVAPPAEKRIELSVEWPEDAPLPDAAEDPRARADPDASRYAALVPAILERLSRNRSTLVFCDARRRAERLAFLLNEAGGEGTAYAHHGSLAKEVRSVVEARLKAGELKCVVATATLELGIDIGSVDEVILAGTPPGIAQALQRAGRSGHGVGETSRAILYPFHGLDLLTAAAAVEGARERAVEELAPPDAPLDILAQVLLSLAAEEARSTDALFDIVRSFPPFEGLLRPAFDSVVELLAGRYADSRVRELEPRARLDRATGLLRAGDGARRLLYSSGGAIPDRGLYAMRVAGDGARVGELDEEFVWERKVGDSFTFGSQAWRIADITAEAVFVRPLGREADFIPFWRGGPAYRSPELTARLLRLMDRASLLDEPGIARLLAEGYGFGPRAAEEAARFLASQRSAQAGAALPSTNAIALELCADPSGRKNLPALIIHSLRGGAVNEPLALVLAAAWEEAGGLPAESYADDEGLLLVLPEMAGGGPGLAEFEGLLRSLGDRRRILSLLRSRLETSGLFAAQFRENAGRALLLPRGFSGRRTPLWMTRLRAAKLYEAVRSREDFPIVAETWRSCLAELFDLDALGDLCAGLAAGSIAIGSFRSSTPSPLARGALWLETSELLYRGDDLGGRPSSLSDRAIEAALASSRLRPRLDPALVEDYARRLKRLLPGWAPEDPMDLAEWVKERVLLPLAELPELLSAAGPGLAAALAEDPGVGGRLLRVRLPGAAEEVLIHAEREGTFRADPGSLLAEWFRREALVEPERLSSLFGIHGTELDVLLVSLIEEGILLRDAFLRGSERLQVVDAENLEVLLRLTRRAARPRVEARPAADLFRLIGALHGLGMPAPAGGTSGSRERLAVALDRLSGYPAPVPLWESDLLPARFPEYSPPELDALLAEEPRLWFGAGREQVAFAAAEEYELLVAPRAAGSRLLPEDGEFLDFWEIRERSGLDVRAAALALWEEAWEGLVAGEGFRPLREGLRNRFGRDLPELGEPRAASGADRRRLPRALRERWRSGAPVSGRWYRLDLEAAERDALDEEELGRDRARLLLARYGLLTKPFLDRELSILRWGEVFGALRRMELAGEVVYGRFFEGLPSPQFMSLEAFELFRRLDSLPPAAPVWLSALDPASPAAFPFDDKPMGLPARAQGNRLCLAGGLLVASLARSGRELWIAPGSPESLRTAALAGLVLLRRRSGKRLELESLNGEAAADSPYAEELRAAGFERDRGRLILW